MTPEEFYRQHTHPLILPLLHISWRGLRVDQAKRQEATVRLTALEAEQTAALHTMVGRPIDPHSAKQLMELTYQEYKCKPITRLRTNSKGEKVYTPTLDEVAIAELLTQTIPDALRPMLYCVLAIREAHKLVSTYLTAPLDEDGKLRCSYALTGTETGRLSARETHYGTGTNLQNVPPGIVREMVIAEEGTTFLSADLSQAEARLVAYLAEEPALIQVFESGGDIHRKNASHIFRVAEEAVTPEQRRLAKKTVHASNYGMGAAKFAQETHLPKTEAQRLLYRYFDTYPGIKRWHLQTEETLKKTRTLTTPLGRRREFWGRWNDDLLRAAYAFVPQATASDLLNQGLVDYERQRPGEILLQVHDSLIVQVAIEQVAAAREALQACLIRPLPIHTRICTIPITIKQGPSWGALD